jgi:glycosyltransferase involved in cell wall biosynthesis
MSSRPPANQSRARVVLALHRVGPYHHVRFAAACRHLDLTVVETRPESQEYPWLAEPASLPYGLLRIHGASDPESDPSLASLKRQWKSILQDTAAEAVVSVGWADRSYQVLLQQAQRRRLPLVMACDSRQRDRPRSAAREWLKRQLLTGYSSAVVAGSESRAYLRQLGFPPQAIHQPWDVVDNAYFLRLPPQPPPPHGPHFLCVSRFVPKKNHATLLSAYARYQADGGTWGLDLVGFGPLEPQLFAAADSLPHPNRCRIRPFLQLPELALAYRQASALVLASLVDQWGLVVNEAIAAGLPALVSSGCGCAADLIEPGVSGLTFDPADGLQLTRQLHALQRLSPVQRQAMVAAARKRLDDFSPASCGLALQAAVAQALTRPRRRWRSRLVAGVLSRLV